MRITIDIPGLTMEQWFSEEYDDLCPVLREEIKSMERVFLASEKMDWDVSDPYGTDPVISRRRSYISEYLSGGLRTPPNPNIPGRVRMVIENAKHEWISETVDEWCDSNEFDYRAYMYRLEDLDDVISSEAFCEESFVEEVWLDTVMNEGLPWIIVDLDELEALRLRLGDGEDSGHLQESVQTEPDTEFDMREMIQRWYFSDYNQ